MRRAQKTAWWCSVSILSSTWPALQESRMATRSRASDAKRGDIGTTSAAYAEAFLGDGDFNCDAVTVNPYQGSDAVMPFIAKVKNGRGVFVLVKTSNPSSGEFQDLNAPDRPIWESVAARVNGWGSDHVGTSGLSSVGAVVGATYPVQARRARELMPQ